jgi:hypothetical protein
MRLVILYIPILIGFLSCKKETFSSIDINSMWECNKSKNLDSTALASKLTGSWSWSKQSCAWTGENRSVNRNLKVTFRNNYTLSVTDGANMLTEGTWRIVKLDVNSLGLTTSAQSTYLSGRILYCDTQVLFNDSYIDGCDNLFVKSD